MFVPKQQLRNEIEELRNLLSLCKEFIELTDKGEQSKSLQEEILFKMGKLNIESSANFWRSYVCGLKDGGEISFCGVYNEGKDEIVINNKTNRL